MPSTILYRPGEVVLIPFPFTDFSTLKQRPALIISSADFNSTCDDIIVTAITSHISRPFKKDEYFLNSVEQKACGLPKPSVVKLGKIVTLEKRLIRKKLGDLPEQSLEAIKSKLEKILDFSE